MTEQSSNDTNNDETQDPVKYALVQPLFEHESAEALFAMASKLALKGFRVMCVDEDGDMAEFDPEQVDWAEVEALSGTTTDEDLDDDHLAQAAE